MNDAAKGERTVTRRILVVAVIFVFLLILGGVTVMQLNRRPPQPTQATGREVELPAPRLESTTSLEQALHQRRSMRSYGDAPLPLEELAQLLWAAQGITHPAGYRTAASAGALYPLEVVVATGNVSDLPAGVYRYNPHQHTLRLVREGDIRKELGRAAAGQEWIADGAAVIALAAVYERTTGRYGQRGRQYVHMETGIAYQNVHLQAVALGLGTVFVGAFDDDSIHAILQLTDEERPLCLMPIGRPGS